jgi:hypothetical protein
MSRLVTICLWLPNQSLKLTEPAVSFSPRAKKFLRERQYLPRVYSTWNWLFAAAA